MDDPGTTGETGGGEPVSMVHEALSQCLTPQTDCRTTTVSTPSLPVKELLTVGKDLVNLLVAGYKGDKDEAGEGAFQTVSDVYAAFNRSPDMLQAVNCIQGSLACYVAADSYGQDTNTYGGYAGRVKSAYLNLQSFSDPHYAGAAYQDSAAATQSAGDISMFAHAYVPQLTDGNGRWKQIFRDHGNPIDPDIISVDGNNIFEQFDWRLGFSRFLALIPLELAIMGTYDRDFVKNGRFNRQLDGSTSDWRNDPVPGYRHLLQQHLQRMLDGVRCDYSVSVGNVTAICVDVNTGLSQQVDYPPPGPTSCPSTAFPNYRDCERNWSQAPRHYGELRRRLALQMPVFEVNAVIDALYHVTHPLPDLTEGTGRIPLDDNATLCLDVLNGNSGTPAVLARCNGTNGQKWSYNRTKGTIRNTAYGKCLQVRGDDLREGAFAEIGDCVEPLPPRQQWTYNPEKSTLRSALGTMLDVKGYEALELPAPIQLVDEHGGGSQRWRAELGTPYCQDICQRSMCPSSCSSAGANSGACWSACMPACVQACSGPGTLRVTPSMPQRISGDFNGDGVGDLIVVTASGSYEYTGRTGGGFTPNVWVRNDLTLGNVNYVTGNFNGDRATDLLIVTANGSYQYLGRESGGFTPDAWVRHDLTLGTVDYTPGDFNGDGKTDLLIVHASGTYEYTGLAGGGFTPNVWVRHDLTLGNVKYVPGNYDTNTTTDLVIVTAAGASKYWGLAGGGMAQETITVQGRVIVPQGAVPGALGARYIPGDFNGDGRTDFILVTASGSSEFLASGPGFAGGYWTRADLKLGVVDYVPGDFNGDRITDLVVVTASGSYQYTGRSSGGFNADVWVRNDLKLGDVSYFKGSFNGDGFGDLVVVTAGGSSEFTGRGTGGFNPDVWVRSDLRTGVVDYF